MSKGPRAPQREAFPPIEAGALALYPVSGIGTAIAMLWLVGAVRVYLSRAWTRLDKWVAAANALAGTALGMSTWRPDAEYVYIDQMIAAPLFGPGLVGMRVAAVAVGCHLLVRLGNTARDAGRPIGSPTGKRSGI